MANAYGLLARQPSRVLSPDVDPHDVVISAVIDARGREQVLSRYDDDVWHMWPFFRQASVAASEKAIRWQLVPADFRPAVKAIIYRYWKAGRPGSTKPTARTIHMTVSRTLGFLRYLETCGVGRLSDVRPIHISNYVHREKVLRRRKPRGLTASFSAIEVLYEFRQESEDRLQMHPWPGCSAVSVAGFYGAAAGGANVAATPLIPPDILCTLFKFAEGVLATAPGLLDERDAGSLTAHSDPDLLLIRDACFFLLGLLTGMRFDELAGVEVGAARTEHKAGVTYHWIASIEHKTKKGAVEYLMPSVGHRILAVMERWSAPLRTRMARQQRRLDRHAAERLRCEREATASARRIFVGLDTLRNEVAPLTTPSWNRRMKAFAKQAGVDWPLAPHQLRRTYAWTFVRHRLGSLLFLKEQFKHSSLDMTQLYAANPQQDEGLYDEILDEAFSYKVDVINHWLDDASALSGGAGRRIVQLRAHDFEDRKAMIEETAERVRIRSTGHAWCLAQDDGCGGAGLYERTRCVDCGNAVIDESFQQTWLDIQAQQEELLDEARVLGPGALQRVQSDIRATAKVLVDLGVRS